MPTAEWLGILGALIVATAAAFVLRARRNVQREAAREEETLLCISHFQTLAVALHSYRQDHDGELPRKFLCPPNDRRLAGGWSANWNEASLAEYVSDADIYLCPDRGQVYSDRIPSLLRDGPRQLMRPAPESVVMYCRHHAVWGGNDRWGEFIVLRLNGAVERIPASEAEFWRYGEGQWYAPDEEAPDGASVFEVFPGEPWPPRLEPAPDRPWWPGDGDLEDEKAADPSGPAAV